MATTSKEKILTQDGNTVIELFGKDKEDFIADRETVAQTQALMQANKETQKALKVFAYTKLGLTQEEIDAIL